MRQGDRHADGARSMPVSDKILFLLGARAGMVPGTMLLPYTERLQCAEQITHTVLDPHAESLSACQAVAARKLGEYARDFPDDYLDLDDPTRRSMLNRFAIGEALKRFPPGMAGVTERIVGREHAFIFEERVAVVFKGLDRVGLPSNYPTRRQLRREEQLLPGMPQCIELIVGHIRHEGALAEVRVVCPRNRRKNYWSYSLSLDMALVAPPPRVLPVAAPNVEIRARREAQ